MLQQPLCEAPLVKDQWMSTSHRFLASEGLMPSTIFDKGDTDMDVSEEMEEVRELLYEMIKKNFPMGVSSSHLAQKYYEEYVSKGLGRELPEDWLVQVAEAEEFEAQIRGPLTILFVRLSNTSSFKKPPVPHTDVKILTSDYASSDVELMKLRKDRYPLDHAEKLSHTSASLQANCDVVVVAFESSRNLYIRAIADDPVFESLKADMRKFYAKNSSRRRVQIYEVLSGGAYALCDAAGDWFRIIAMELPRSGTIKCFFCDVGVIGVYPVVDLRLLPDPEHPIMSVGALAKRVSLSLPDYAVGQSSDHILHAVLFEKDVMGNFIPVRMKLNSLMETEVDDETISFADLSMTDGKAVIDMVISNIPDSKECISLVNCETTSKMHVPSSSASLPPTVCVFDGEIEIIPMDISQIPTNTFSANALFAAGPGDISLRQVSLDPMPDYMYEKLAEECQMSEASLTIDPRPGGFYAACINERWERVQCIRASKIDNAAFCVYLIDVGAFHYVRAEALRRLNVKTPFKRMLMFKCRVANIVPVEGQDVWSRESHEAVREFFEAGMGGTVMQCMGCFCKLQVTPVANSCGLWKQLNAPAVPFLTARISCCGRDLADWLISHQLALPKPI
ncbi:tudor domain protein [Dictyocaulus viviparus]|uniref:Tudor domain protein n=1 Tax=Dictyocaulus viviparus TaxID=29172 RepID=A0A0D8XGZ3_DICVI|nr:tudor domain protein [Dictyocaulus viviparus]